MVGWSWDVLADGVVAVGPLMQGKQTQEVGSGVVGGRRATMLPVDSGLVVTKSYNCVAPGGVEVGQQVQVGNMPCQLQMRVGDGALRLIAGDQLLLELRGKWPAPGNARGVGTGGWEPDTAHATFGCIMSTNKRNRAWE